MKALTCPNCGSPLEHDSNKAVLECYYCKHHIVLATGALTQEPAQAIAHAPKKERRRKRGASGSPSGSERKRAIYILAGTVPAVLVGAAAAIHLAGRSAAPPAAASSEPTLRSLELSISREEATKLLGVEPTIPNQLTKDFVAGNVRRAEVQWDAQDKRYASTVTLFLRPGAIEAKTIIAKLRTIVPNRIEPQGTGHRIKMGDAVLDVQLTTVKVWHWTSVHPAGLDPAACGARRAAFWSAARFAALDGRAVSGEEVALINGPPLAELPRLDATLTVEQVGDEFSKTFSAGRCVSQAGVICQTDVDHPLVSEVKWRWPNAVKGRLREVRFAFWPRADAVKAQRAVAGCLQAALGAGEESVTDYVKGTRTWTFPIGKAGDKASLSERELVFSEAASAKPDAPAEWPAKFAAVVAALDRCAL